MFALGQDLSICLRCRLRGEFPALPRAAALRSPRPVQRRQQSTLPAEVPPQQDQQDQQDQRDGAQPAGRSEAAARAPARARRKSGAHARPAYRFGVSPTSWKRVNVHQDSVELGVNALGSPARIRIVRDKPTPAAAAAAAAAPSAVAADAADRPDGERSFNEDEFAAALAGADQETSRQAVNDNIENLRRVFFGLPHGEGFARAQCAAVAAQLNDGVTYDQLAAYASDAAAPARATDVNDLERWYGGRLLARARWFGGTSDFPATAQTRVDERSWALLRGDLAVSSPERARRRKLKHKERLIERVLRDVWGVREQEELARGELDFRVKDAVHMRLLMQHYNAVFKDRAEQFDVRIEIDQPRSLVRISGEYGLTFDAFRLIYKDLKSIRTARIKVQSAPFSAHGRSGDEARPILATESYQQYLEQLTKTQIVARERPEANLSVLDHLDVYYLGSHQRAFDDVQRLVAQTLQTKDPTRTQILCDRQKGSATPTEVPIEPGGVLPVRERYANWKRWTFSPNLDSETELVQKASFVPDVVYRPFSARRIAHSASEHLAQAWAVAGDAAPPPAETSGHWQSRTLCTLTATIGYLVHRADRKIGSRLHSAWQRTYKTKQEQGRMVEQTFASIIQEPRELVTGVPELLARLEGLISSSSPAQNELRVTLRPHKAASLDLSDVGSLPDLELVLALDGSERAVRLQAAQLVRSWRESDVMLPTQATDVRLVSRALIQARQEHVDPAVLQFVAESDLDVWGSGRLRTPAQLTLAVPRFASLEWPAALDRGASGEGVAGGPTSDAAAADHVTVDYMFKSLEHRSRMPAMYQGHQVCYSTVEAGRTGGRWDELAFEVQDVGRDLGGGTGAAGDQAFLDWFDGVREFNARLSS